MSRRRPPTCMNDRSRPSRANPAASATRSDGALPGLDPEFDPLHAELGERVAAEQGERPSRDAVAALVRGDPVAGRAAAALGIEVVQADRAEQTSVGRVDDQRGQLAPGAQAGARHPLPLPGVLLAVGLRDSCVARDLGVLHRGDDRGDIRLAHQPQGDDAVAEARRPGTRSDAGSWRAPPEIGRDLPRGRHRVGRERRRAELLRQRRRRPGAAEAQRGQTREPAKLGDVRTQRLGVERGHDDQPRPEPLGGLPRRSRSACPGRGRRCASRGRAAPGRTRSDPRSCCSPGGQASTASAPAPVPQPRARATMRPRTRLLAKCSSPIPISAAFPALADLPHRRRAATSASSASSESAATARSRMALARAVVERRERVGELQGLRGDRRRGRARAVPARGSSRDRAASPAESPSAISAVIARTRVLVGGRVEAKAARRALRAQEAVAALPRAQRVRADTRCGARAHRSASRALDVGRLGTHGRSWTNT